MKFLIALIISFILIGGTASALSAGEIEAGVNSTRAAHGLAPLADNGALDASAVAKANDLCSKNYWGHYAPDGTAPWTFFYSAGYSGSSLGENLAYNFADAGSLMAAWIASPEHYTNIVGNFTEQGAAVLTCPNYLGFTNVPIAVNHFGLRPIYHAPVAHLQPVIPAAPVAVPAPTPRVIVAHATKKVDKCHMSIIDLLMEIFKSRRLWYEEKPTNPCS